MKIFWTVLANRRYQEIESHIQEEFGEAVKLVFRQRVFGFLAILKKYPKIGSLEVPSKGIYGFQISKQTRLFYRINTNHISLLNFFDTRQDPKKRPS
jgi:plasmid stabilization system protein ParE